MEDGKFLLAFWEYLNFKIVEFGKSTPSDFFIHRVQDLDAIENLCKRINQKVKPNFLFYFCFFANIIFFSISTFSRVSYHSDVFVLFKRIWWNALPQTSHISSLCWKFIVKIIKNFSDTKRGRKTLIGLQMKFQPSFLGLHTSVKILFWRSILPIFILLTQFTKKEICTYNTSSKFNFHKNL